MFSGFSFVKKGLLAMLAMSLLVVAGPFGIQAFTANLQVTYPTDGLLDFGNVANGQTVNRAIQFTNNTSQAAKVYLSGIDSGVFSTTVSSLDNAITVGANSSSSILVSAKPNANNVPTYKDLIDTVRVVADYATLSDEVVQLQLKAIVQPRSEVTPVGSITQSATSLNFGTLSPGTIKVLSAKFYNSYNVPVGIVESQIINDNYGVFSSRLLDGTSVAANGSSRVELRVDLPSNAPANFNYQATYRLRTDEKDANRYYYVTLSAKADSPIGGIPALRLSRTTVDFGDLDIDANTKYGSVTFYNDTYNDINLYTSESVDSPFSGPTVSGFRIPARSFSVIEFGFNPSTVRNYSDVVTYYINTGQGQAYYSVTLRGGAVDGDYREGETYNENLITDFTATVGTNNSGNISVIYPRFRVTSDSYVDLRILDSSDRVVARVFSDRFFNARSTTESYSYTLPVSLTGGYSYRADLIATSSTGRYSDTDSYRINGYNDGGINPGGNCSGFTDVAANSDFCTAVKFAYDQGIFTGDTGGSYRTLRPNDPVSRAEAVAIMLRAVDASQNSNSYPLPFYDVREGDWYTGYLRKAVSLGAINGYPDGTFRPGQTMTRAEFYKAFLKTVKNQGRGNFFINSDVRYRPFMDVTLQAVNDWYLPYADFARRYFNGSAFAARQYDATNLGTNEPLGRFKPNQLMTRAHIIELIYEMNVRNIADF